LPSGGTHPYEKIEVFVLTSKGGLAKDTDTRIFLRRKMSLYGFNKAVTELSNIRRYLILHRPPLKPEEQILRPGVFEKLAELRAAGHKIAIVTNQSIEAFHTRRLAFFIENIERMDL
jgi:hypothetical protein